MKLTIAFLQLLPTGSLKGNMEKGIKACFQAKEKGADIAIFPEMWSCGYVFPHEEVSLRECAIPRYGSFVKRFAELAAELDMAIAITFLEQHEPKPRNTVCLFDRHGKIQYCYSKVHICNFGEEDDESVLDAGDDFFVTELDVDMLREYRHREVWGCKNRRPEVYGIISERNHYVWNDN